MFHSTLEQWQLLRSVVEEGSIAKAGDKLFRSQPSISYQLNQLQQRLGIELLELQGRKLALTKEGRALLEQASLLLDGWQDLELKAQSIQQGERAVINLVVDSLYPKAWLFAALKQFNQQYPNTHIHLKETVRDEGRIMLDQANDDVYVISLDHNAKVEKARLTDVQFMLVAHRDHDIFRSAEHLRASQLKRFPMIQVVDRHHQQAAHSPTKYQESWFFTSLPSAIDAIVNNLGCGWLPESEIQTHLASGELQPISSQASMSRVTSLYLVKNDQVRYDACVQALADALQNNKARD